MEKRSGLDSRWIQRRLIYLNSAIRSPSQIWTLRDLRTSEVWMNKFSIFRGDLFRFIECGHPKIVPCQTKNSVIPIKFLRQAVLRLSQSSQPLESSYTKGCPNSRKGGIKSEFIPLVQRSNWPSNRISGQNLVPVARWVARRLWTAHLSWVIVV